MSSWVSWRGVRIQWVVDIEIGRQMNEIHVTEWVTSGSDFKKIWNIIYLGLVYSFYFKIDFYLNIYAHTHTNIIKHVKLYKRFGFSVRL